MKENRETLRIIKRLRDYNVGHEGCDCNPVAVGELVAVVTGFQKFIAAIRTKIKTELARKTALLETARILRLVLG